MSEVKRDTYNGWANRSTWLAVLWLTNTESTNDDLRSIALSGRSGLEKEQTLKAYLEELTLGALDNETHKFTPDFVTERFEAGKGLATDLVSQELMEIDYRAIIESVEV